MSDTAFRPMKSSYGMTSGKPGGDEHRNRRRELGPRQPALDPHEQRDEEERRDVEHVPLGDAERLLGREHGHDEHEPEGQAERGSDEDAIALRQLPRHEREEDAAPRRG